MCLGVAIGVALSPGAARAAPDAQLMAAVQACEPDARALLEQLVSIDSGTGDAEGLDKVGAILTRELLMSGAKVDAIPAEPPRSATTSSRPRPAPAAARSC